MQQPIDDSAKKKPHFWLPIIAGTISALLLFTILLYFNWLNVASCLAIPILSGFVTLSVANPIIKTDKICQLCLPWASLVLLVPFAYWKLKILIIVMFPIASLGGWLAAKLFIKLRSYSD